MSALHDIAANAKPTCLHTRTHPQGCDDCPAEWCAVCTEYHEAPVAVIRCSSRCRATDLGRIAQLEEALEDANKRIADLEADVEREHAAAGVGGYWHEMYRTEERKRRDLEGDLDLARAEIARLRGRR